VRRRRHAPDFFFARLLDGTGVVVDVRPYDRIEPADAFAAMSAACTWVGWQFRRVRAPYPGGQRIAICGAGPGPRGSSDCPGRGPRESVFGYSVLP